MASCTPSRSASRARVPCSAASCDQRSSQQLAGVCGASASAPLHPALVADQPQQGEVGVELALHHRFQVKLHVGGAGQADVVAQDAQAQAVADDAPQMVVGAVEELLQQAVRAALGAPGRGGPAPGGR